MSKILIESEPVIYATGAFLKPIKITDSDGKEIWVWYVSEFIESSFKDGEEYNPKENANSLAELVTEIE
jgi:hypothetical protein